MLQCHRLHAVRPTKSLFVAILRHLGPVRCDYRACFCQHIDCACIWGHLGSDKHLNLLKVWTLLALTLVLLCIGCSPLPRYAYVQQQYASSWDGSIGLTCQGWTRDVQVRESVFSSVSATFACLLSSCSSRILGRRPMRDISCPALGAH